MKKLRIIIAVLLLMAVCVIGISCGGQSKQIQISYSGGRIGFGDQMTSSQQGNRITANLHMFTSEGHHLIGFFTEEGVQYFDGNGYQLPDILIENRIHVVPREEPNVYNFTFDCGDGTIAEEEFSFTYGENKEFPVPTHTNISFAFDGWFDGETRYTEGGVLVNESYKNLEHNATVQLTARYKKREHTVTVNFNDGVTEDKYLKIPYGQKISGLEDMYMDGEGKDITSWSLVSYGTTPLPDVITEDITIFAVWTEYVDVSFYVNDECYVKRVHMVPGQSVVLPRDVAPGLRVDEWFNNSAFSGNPVGNIPYGAVLDKYYGKPYATDYKITFITENGEAIEDITYKYGQKITLPTVTKEGYLFLGWKRDGDKTLYMETSREDFGDITYTAVYRQSTPISSIQDLELVRKNPLGSYHLTCDIDMQGVEFEPIKELFGIIDGNGYKIQNAVLTARDGFYGLILKNRGEIWSLSLENPTVEISFENQGDILAGMLCSKNDGVIDNCTVKGAIIKISASNGKGAGKVSLGALCAQNTGNINECDVDSTFEINLGESTSGIINVGGAVGINDGYISALTVKSKMTEINGVRARCNGGIYAGGVVSQNNGEICLSGVECTLSFMADRSDGWDKISVGGFACVNNGKISECYSKGTASAKYGKLSGASLGGLSSSSGGEIINCYSKVNLTAQKFGEYCSVGGLCGSADGKVFYSYYNGTISASGCRIGGLCGTTQQNAFVKSCFTNYSCSFGSEGGVSAHCSFYTTGTNERDLFEVLDWDRDVWYIDGKLPIFSREVKYVDIIVPEIPSAPERDDLFQVPNLQ